MLKYNFEWLLFQDPKVIQDFMAFQDLQELMVLFLDF